jgi:lipoate-protein ligase A
MDPMKLYHLRHVPWLDSQLLYHAMPRVNQEGVLILAPAEPYVCIGYHQDLAQEVDLDYCREHGIPMFRREVGGGAVYLDGNQIFYQIVLHREHPLAQGDKSAFYQRLLEPVAQCYNDLGVTARYRPVNDIVTAEGRKIAGTGAATIGEYVILVGNLIADFDYETMVRVLKVPDEKFRGKVFQSMRQNLTTLQRELGQMPTWDEMADPLLRRFEAVLGPLEAAEIPRAVYEQAAALQPTYLSEEWLYSKSRQRPGRAVKIATGVNVLHRLHKAPGGLIRATLDVRDGALVDVSLSGDFFCYPQDAVSQLEDALKDTPLKEAERVLEGFYRKPGIEIPGVTVADWVQVLGA